MCAKWPHRDQLEPIKPGSPPALPGTGGDAEGTCDRLCHTNGGQEPLVDPMLNTNARLRSSGPRTPWRRWLRVLLSLLNGRDQSVMPGSLL